MCREYSVIIVAKYELANCRSIKISISSKVLNLLNSYDR